MRDRRVFARICARFPLKFICPGRENECFAETVDISAIGVRFLTKERLSARTPLEMWLDLPGQQELFYTRGRVVWSSPMPENGGYRVGVHLEKAELMGFAKILWK